MEAGNFIVPLSLTPQYIATQRDRNYTAHDHEQLCIHNNAR